MDRQMSLNELQESGHGFTNLKTLRNYKSILNKVNDHYGWTRDIIHFDRMEDRAKEVANFIYKAYKISNTEQFKQKLCAISSLMTRTNFQEFNNLSMMVGNPGRFLSVEDKSVAPNIMDWEVLQPKLVQLGKQCNVCGVIASIFSYGYVLRVAEIFETRVDQCEQDNYLDLDNCVWHIRKQKKGAVKSFEVNGELCARLKAWCMGRKRDREEDPFWLICKTNGKKYAAGGKTLSYHGWRLPCNADIRKSYETWNRHNSGRTEEEKIHWHTILGHSKNTVKEYYDTKAFEEPEKTISKPVKPKPIFKLKLRPLKPLKPLNLKKD